MSHDDFGVCTGGGDFANCRCHRGGVCFIQCGELLPTDHTDFAIAVVRHYYQLIGCVGSQVVHVSRHIVVVPVRRAIVLIDVIDNCLVGSQSVLGEYRLRSVDKVKVRSLLPHNNFGVCAGGCNLANRCCHRGGRYVRGESGRIGSVACHGDGTRILRVPVLPLHEMVTRVGYGRQRGCCTSVIGAATGHRSHCRIGTRSGDGV